MLTRDLFTTDRLFCPGPTPVPRPIAEAAAAANLYHRSEEFYRIVRRCVDRLRPLFGCQTDPVLLTSSGTGGMEAILVNLTDPGDQVVVVNGGKFGERWEKLAQVYGLEAAVVRVPWGQAPTAAAIAAAVKSQARTRAIFLQANETSTGAYYDVESIARELRATLPAPGPLLVVDAISSLGAHTMRMDEWHIDAVVAGSQKGFGLPPGLAFVAMSERAWQKPSQRPRFYFDLAKERLGQANGRTAWTPAASLIIALDLALAQFHDIGLDHLAAHHAHLAEASRAAATAMGLELFAATAPSHALTAMTVPEGVDGQRLLKRLRQRFGMFFAGGQDELKGKLVRFSHLGFVSRFDLIDGLAALEFALAEEGYRGALGAGVTAAMRSLAATGA